MADKKRKLRSADAAKAAGVKLNTWSSYVSRNQAPQPDDYYDERTPYWYASTIEDYLATRPGRGQRQAGSPDGRSSPARSRRSFTPEERARAVELLRSSGRSMRSVALELGIAPSLLARWNRSPESTP